MFLLTWSDEGFDEMGRIILLHAGRRAEIGAAMRSATDRLHRNPLGEGESRDGDVRVLFDGPLTVYYRIDKRSPVVEIARVVFAG